MPRSFPGPSPVLPRAFAGPLPGLCRSFAGTLTNSFVKQRNSFVKHGILLLNDFLNFTYFLHIFEWNSFVKARSRKSFVKQWNSFVKHGILWLNGFLILRGPNMAPECSKSRRVLGPGRPDGEIYSFCCHFRPDQALAAQTVELLHFGTIFDQIRPMPPRPWNMFILVTFSTR